MFNVNQALKDRAETQTKLDALIVQAGTREFTAPEEEQFNSLKSQKQNIQARIDRHAKGLPQLDSGLMPPVLFAPGQGQEAAPHKGNSIASTLKAALRFATPEQREEVEALASYVTGTGRAMSLSNLTPGADGGVFIPSFVQGVIERNFSQFSPVVDNCRLFATDTGADTTFPVLSDSESGEQLDPAALTGLDATVSGDTPPTEITGPKLHAYKISSKPVYVPRELQTDSPIDIMSEIIGALLARVIRFENLRFTKGTGTSQAEGFLTHATPFEHSGGVLDLDAALDLAYSVPALYRPQGIYMASDKSIKYLRWIKTGISGDKRQLWGYEEPNAVTGTPARLHGYPILVNNDMSDVNSDGTYSGKSVLAFGDFQRFVVRQAEQNKPYIYRYPVPAKDGWGLIIFRRSDSKLLVPSAISKLTVGGS